MSFGLEIRTTAGNIAFTTADNLMTFFDQGSFTITHGSSTTSSISVSGLTNDSLFHVFVLENQASVFENPAIGTVTKSNGTFTFQRQTSSGSADTTGTMSYVYTVIKTA
tara:strand:+ start:729 stop:1055 length:327 start_codon:yes stop_codon:yes gene_type:complete